MSAEFKSVYIMGRAHNGSTVADVLLGNAPGVESIGEITSGLNRGQAEKCSCGKTLAECEYWQAVSRLYREKSGADLYEDGRRMWRMSDTRNFFSALFGDFADAKSRWSGYARTNRQILSAIAGHAGKNVIVDSNKEYTRAVCYLKSDPQARVIHLLRRPVSVVGSYYYRIRDGRPLKFLKKEYQPKLTLFPALMMISFTWSIGMVLALIVKARFPDRVLHVSYEKLTENPRTELTRIGEFIGVDLSGVIEGIEQERVFPVGHNVGGNDQRHEGGYRFIRNTRGRRAMPAMYRFGANVLSFPGMVLRWAFVRA